LTLEYQKRQFDIDEHEKVEQQLKKLEKEIETNKKLLNL
jgi:hypothetical protein